MTDGPPSRLRASAVTLLVGAVAVVIGIYAFELITGTTFTTDQWAAAGGWVGGIGTLAAVAVALWQSRSARQAADTARADARALLTKELDAQRRSQQISAAADLVPAITEYELAIVHLNDRMYETTNDLASPEGVETWPVFDRASRKLDDALIRCQMIVDVAEVLDAVNALSKSKQRIDEFVSVDWNMNAAGVPPSDDVPPQVERLREERGSLIGVVRRYLTPGSPEQGTSIHQPPAELPDEGASGGA